MFFLVGKIRKKLHRHTVHTILEELHELHPKRKYCNLIALYIQIKMNFEESIDSVAIRSHWEHAVQ